MRYIHLITQPTVLAAACIIVAIGASIASRGASAQDRPLHFGIDENVEEWLRILEADGVGVYAIVGDSISFRGNSYNWFLRDLLEARYGNGGDGYLGFNFGFRHRPNNVTGPREGLDLLRANATWVEFGTSQNNRSQFGLRSPDGIYSRIGAGGWIEVDFFGPRGTLHYIREPGAGVIELKLNGDVVAEIDASLPAGSPPALGLHTFETGQIDPTVINTLRLSLVGATETDPQWTQLNGLQMTTDRPGIQYHRIARGGAGPDDFLSADPALYTDVLRQLDPDLLIVMLDPRRDIDLPHFYEDMNALLDFYATALPDVEIVLISHHPFRKNREQVTEWLIEMAEQRDHGFINLFDLHTGFAHLDQLGMLADSVHFSAIGGSWHGTYVFDMLDGWRTASSFSMVSGTVEAGSLYELRNRETMSLDARSAFGFSAQAPNVVEIESHHTVTTPQPTLLDARYVWMLDTPGGMACVLMWNHPDEVFVEVAEGTTGTARAVQTFTDIPSDDLIGPSGQVRVRTRLTMVATFSATGFVARVDDVKVRAR